MKKLILFMTILKTICAVPRLDPLVETHKGLIRGLHSNDGGDYVMFLGIPYALVDENNPFGSAVPHPGFNETFQAHHDGVACPQVNPTPMGTIQCLQLNIFVPNSASLSNKLPVMVFQHGGSFIGGHKGTKNFSPKFLLKHDVIYVSINYRLGPYGFLCVSEPGYNNQGIRDQVLAYKWIKENIAAFGGDVNRITAFGHSAGSMTLDGLIQARDNLVHRVILHSGIISTTWVPVTTNDSIPINMAQKLGLKTENVKEALKYLSTQDELEVMQAAEDLSLLNRGGHPLTKPCIEYGIGGDVMLSDYAANVVPKVKGMDIMVGYTSREVMFLYPNFDEAYYANYNFGNEEISKAFKEVHDVDTVTQFYLGDKKPSIDLIEVIQDFGSDFAFYYPTELSVQKYFEGGAKNVYRYAFHYEGGRNRGKVLRNYTTPGACHGDDLGYIFDMVLFENKPINDEDQRMIDAMTTMWTNFAKYGNPTPSTSDLLRVQWLLATLDKQNYLKLDKKITLESRPFHDRMAFWKLYYKLHADKLKSNREN